MIRVILFNVGVEVGQLTALAVIVGVGALVVRGLGNRGQAARYAFGAIAVAGLVGAAVISLPDEETRSGEERVVADADGEEAATACTQEDSQPPQFVGGGHPAKQFFGPEEEAPEADLVHVVGDGLVIVRYRPDLPAAEVERLRSFVEHPDSEYVIGAPDAEQTEPVRAVAAYRTLSCEKPDIARLETFRDEWLAYVRQQQSASP